MYEVAQVGRLYLCMKWASRAGCTCDPYEVGQVVCVYEVGRLYVPVYEVIQVWQAVLVY